MDLKPLSWRVLDLLKIQLSPKPSRNTSGTNLKQNYPSKAVSKCCCCGTILLIDSVDFIKYHCAICRTTIIRTYDFNTTEAISMARVQELAAHSMNFPRRNPAEVRLSLKPLLDYLHRGFSSIAVLNNSFHLRRKRRESRAHYSCSNLNLAEVRAVFEFLAQLPSKLPLHSALSGCCDALKRLPLDMFDKPKNICWVMVLLEIPYLRRAFTNSDRRNLELKGQDVEGKDFNRSALNDKDVNASKDEKKDRNGRAEYPMISNHEIQSLLYEILKRALGILAQAEVTFCGNYLASWFSKLSTDSFLSKVNLINLYITFHLKKHYYYANNPALMRREQERRELRSEFVELSYIKDDVQEILPPIAAEKSKKADSKIRFHQYTLNYHLRTASSALGLFVKANFIRSDEKKLPIHAFYNTLVDYVNVKMDFDAWSSKRKAKVKIGLDEPDLQTVIDYIHGNGYMQSMESTTAYYLCQYPFLISLGGKISILEHEARRQMERKAEEAFINSLDRRVALDVYFKVRVRREHIVQDLLLCIQLNGQNLKKSLRVQFVNEPGVDAGGLKKEWFLTLTKLLFSPSAGIFHSVEESNFLWFNLAPAQMEKYYLFGAILGLAIYNSTILDLSFPLSMYKLLLGLPTGLSDYRELFPVAAKNLFQLRSFSSEELESLDLAFEVCVSSGGKTLTVELAENGSSIRVTTENLESYIDKYAKFYLHDGIQAQIKAFKSGFSSVVDGNAFSLFLPEEIQLLLCGSEQKNIDVEVLKSITCYGGWLLKPEAENSQIVRWFWDYLRNLTYQQQKRVLLFITGLDRVPATGLQNFHLRISRLENGADSDRLPVAHTCFNELALYAYGTREKMERKLNDAVNMSAGFGIK